MSIVAFLIGGPYIVLAWLVLVKHTPWLSYGLNTVTEENNSKMNLPAIRRTKGIGYLIIGLVLVIAGFLNLAGISGAVECAIIVMIVGTCLLPLLVQRFNGNNYNAEGNLVKPVKYGIVGTFLFMLIIIGFVCWQGTATLREPSVSFSNEIMTIDCEYGTSISATDIETVYLIDEPVTFRYRTNGSSLFGTYRGHYTSDIFNGSVLVYAKADSAPWICIQRKEGPVLICLSETSDTKALYSEIVSWLK